VVSTIIGRLQNKVSYFLTFFWFLALLLVEFTFLSLFLVNLGKFVISNNLKVINHKFLWFLG